MTYRIVNRKTGKSLCVYQNQEGVFKLRGDAILYVLDKNLSEKEWKIVEREYGKVKK